LKLREGGREAGKERGTVSACHELLKMVPDGTSSLPSSLPPALPEVHEGLLHEGDGDGPKTRHVGHKGIQLHADLREGEREGERV